ISTQWPPARRRPLFRLIKYTKYSRRDAMRIFISRGRFTSDAIKGMLAKPENREEAVAKLFQSVGGRLVARYLTFGHHDRLASGVLAAAAGASRSAVETTPAISATRALAPFESPATAAKASRTARRLYVRKQTSALVEANRITRMRATQSSLTIKHRVCPKVT